MSVDICYSKMRLILHKLHIFYAFYADDTIIDRRIFAYIYILFNISSHEKKNTAENFTDSANLPL